MAYDPAKTYAKYLLKKHKEGKDKCGCGGSCDSCKTDKCGCCPPGLVAVYDDKGNHAGCLTANDAETFIKNSYVCEDGYVRLVRVSDSAFLGCVSESQYQTLYLTVNPTP